MMPVCPQKATSARAGAMMLAALTLLAWVFAPKPASGVDAARPTEHLTIVSGKSVIFDSPQRIVRISEPDPEIVTAIVVSPHQVYLTGKAAGTTNLILWHDKNRFTIRDLEVVYDVSRLKQRLHEVLPEEKDIRVMAANGAITLAGRISSTANLSQALALAAAFTPKAAKDEAGQVVNLLQVGGIHQVMLEIRVAEMKRSLANRLGFNLGGTNGEDAFGITTLGGLSQVVKPSEANLSVGPVGLLVSPAVNAIFRFSTGSITWTGFIDALNQDGLAKILAEPTLITLSGQTATFLAGGEYPVPVPQGLGTAAIEFKPFGVSLAFTPTVLSHDKISIQVAPEVSELDFSVAQRLEGFIIPGLTTRKASTVVELADGQSFAIAGLLQESMKESISKYPLLGDIPILGALFRSSSFQKNETELVIIATPHIVKPLNIARQPLPGDEFIEPSYGEFFLEGRLEGRGTQDLTAVRGEMDGDFGYSLPK